MLSDQTTASQPRRYDNLPACCWQKRERDMLQCNSMQPLDVPRRRGAAPPQSFPFQSPPFARREAREPPASRNVQAPLAQAPGCRVYKLTHVSTVRTCRMTRGPPHTHVRIRSPGRIRTCGSRGLRGLLVSSGPSDSTDLLRSNTGYTPPLSRGVRGRGGEGG